MGFTATLPIMFLASALGYFLYRKLWFFPLSAFLIAGFYGKMAVLPDPVSYAVFSLLLGAVCEADILMLPAGERIAGAIRKLGFWKKEKLNDG